MEKAANIILVRDIKKGQPGIPAGLPAQATIYKLNCLRKYPRLIYTVPGAGLVFDLDEWAAMCERAKQASEERARKVHKALR